MAEFNLLEKTADERRSELYGLAPYLVYKVGDRTYNYGAKAAAALFYNGALADVNPTEILSIGARVTALNSCFYNNSSLIKIHCENWDVALVETLNYAFYGCSSLKSLNLSKWDTSSCISFANFVRGCTSLYTLGLPTIPAGCATSNAFLNTTALANVSFGVGCKIYPSLDFASCPLTAESVIDILEHLADTPDAGATITFKAGIYAGFTSAEREVIDALTRTAVGNGWTIVNLKDFAVYEWNQLREDRPYFVIRGKEEGESIVYGDNFIDINTEGLKYVYGDDASLYYTSANNGHTVFVKFTYSGGGATKFCYKNNGYGTAEFSELPITQEGNYSKFCKTDNIGTSRYKPTFYIDGRAHLTNFNVHNLTQLFGEGNEPTDVALFEAWLEDNGLSGYQPYDAGTPRVLTKPSWIA